MGTYSFQNVSASLSGPGGYLMNVGYGAEVAEEGISYSLIEDANTMLTGSDGGIMHSMHAGQSGSLVIRLQKTSPVNKQINDMYLFQKSSPANWGSNIIRVNDSVRGDLVVGTQLAFRKLPDNGFSKTGGLLEWVFDGRLSIKLGGG